MPELPSWAGPALEVFGHTVSNLALLYVVLGVLAMVLFPLVFAIWGKEPPIVRIYAIIAFGVLAAHMALKAL